MADARGKLEWLVRFVDGNVVRAHQHAAGTRRQPVGARGCWGGGSELHVLAGTAWSKVALEDLIG